MKRRQFLGMMATGVAAAALGGAVEAASDADTKAPTSKPAVPALNDGRLERKLSPEAQLVSYCGKYCGKCALSAFNVGLGVSALKKINDTIAVSKAVEMIGFPPIHDMAAHCCADFDRDLESFVEVGKMAFPPCCRKGCAPCEIADCCRKKGYVTCAECDQSGKCEKLAKPISEGDNVHANQKAIREMGLEKWAKTQYDEAISEKKAALRKAIDEAF